MMSSNTWTLTSIARDVTGLSVCLCLCLACDADKARDATRDAAFLENAGRIGFRVDALEPEQDDMDGDDAVTGFVISVSQDGTVVAERYVALENEELPSHLAPDAAAGGRFADAYFVLPVGTYQARAVAVDGTGEPSVRCQPAETAVGVLPDVTIEVFLVAQCSFGDVGGLDTVAVATNLVPTISELVFNPSKFVLACEDLTVTVRAADPDGDAFEYGWELLSRPDNAIYVFEGRGEELAFVARTAGDYGVKLRVCDVRQGCAELTFPIHVMGSHEECELGDDERGCGRTVTMLFTFEGTRETQDAALMATLADQALDWVAPVKEPNVLLLIDDSESCDQTTTAQMLLELLEAASYRVTMLVEPENGILPQHVFAYDVVWLLNPDRPVDDSSTADVLVEFARAGGGVILQGNDMSRQEALRPLTHLEYIENGTRHCGVSINNNRGGDYRVSLEDIDHPVLTSIQGSTLLYGDDIDTARLLYDGEVVLAWAEEASSQAQQGRCDCERKPAIVAFDPASVTDE